MNRWARIVAGVAFTGLAGWLATGLVGRVFDPAAGPAEFTLHYQLGFVSTLALLLANLWFVLFLGLAARAAERLDGSPPPVRALAGAVVRAQLAGAVAIVLVVGQPVLAGALYPNRLSPALHLGSAVAGLLAESLFLVLAIRAGRRQKRLFATLEVAPAPPS